MARLFIFDFDGTVSVNHEFYKDVYSGTLNKLIQDKRGEEGIEVLKDCRKNYDGKGELALFALNIPFREWAKKLIDAPLDLLAPQPLLIRQFNTLRAIKVIYTGSPVEMVVKMLSKLGFSKNDFDLIIGWREPEFFPIKWGCSPLVFESILNRFSVDPTDAWAVGDDWDTDLKPAQVIGMRTATVRKKGGNPNKHFPSLCDFLDSIQPCP